MNLLTILQKERSKKTCIEVADYIGNDKERFAELIEIITGKDIEMANRAAWVIPSIADKNIDQLIQPHLKPILASSSTSTSYNYWLFPLHWLCT